MKTKKRRRKRRSKSRVRKKIWRGVKDEEKTSGRDSLKEMEESKEKEDELRRNEWRGRKGRKDGNEIRK